VKKEHPLTEHPQWRGTELVASVFSIMEAPSPFSVLFPVLEAASLADAVLKAH